MDGTQAPTDALTAALRAMNWHIKTCDDCASYTEGWGDKCRTRQNLENEVDRLLEAEKQENNGHSNQAA